MTRTGRVEQRRRKRLGPTKDPSSAATFKGTEWKSYLESLRSPLAVSNDSDNKGATIAQSCEGMFVSEEIDVEIDTFLEDYRDSCIAEGEASPSSHIVSPHPGLILHALIEGSGIDLALAAKNLKISTDKLSKIFSEEAPISSELSVRISQMLGTRSDFWSELQRRYNTSNDG